MVDLGFLEGGFSAGTRCLGDVYGRCQRQWIGVRRVDQKRKNFHLSKEKFSLA